MKKIHKIMLVLGILILTIGTAIAEDSSSEGTTGGVTLDETALTINLCEKVIKSSGGWGICSGSSMPRGTFSYEPSGTTLEFNAEAIGLSGVIDNPEVTNLALAGATQTTLRWTWTTPNRDYFLHNVVTVNKTDDGTLISSEEYADGKINERISYTTTGLTAGTSYTITVRSVYSKGVSIGTGDASYSLIYYRDTDPANEDPSAKGWLLLDRNNSLNGEVTFSGYQNMNSNIPMISDVNPRGKIWIVPTSELNEDGTLKWTGYGVGNTMTDYLFESDRNINSLPDSIGGITYTDTDKTT